jgi:hypothetical protein
VRGRIATSREPSEADRCDRFAKCTRPFAGLIRIGGAGFARAIAAADFAGEPGFECFDCVGALAEEFDAVAPIAALAAPLPHQCGIAKQARFDREHVIARHVAGGIVAVESAMFAPRYASWGAVKSGQSLAGSRAVARATSVAGDAAPDRPCRGLRFGVHGKGWRLLAPLLIGLRLPALISVGLSQAIEVPIAIMATAGNLWTSNVELSLAASVSLGVVTGDWIAHALPALILARVVAVALFATGLLVMIRSRHCSTYDRARDYSPPGVRPGRSSSSLKP